MSSNHDHRVEALAKFLASEDGLDGWDHYDEGVREAWRELARRGLAATAAVSNPSGDQEQRVEAAAKAINERLGWAGEWAEEIARVALAAADAASSPGDQEQRARKAYDETMRAHIRNPMQNLDPHWPSFRAGFLAAADAVSSPDSDRERFWRDLQVIAVDSQTRAGLGPLTFSIIDHGTTATIYVDQPSPDSDHLKHIIYDAYKFLPDSPETAAAILKKTAETYDQEQRERKTNEGNS